MHKKKDINYVYHTLQLVLVGLLIMFICTYFAGVKATEPFARSGENIKICIYCLLFSFLPFVLKKWSIHSTKTLQVYYLVAIMVHFLLGTTLNFYRDVWYFSWIVHLINSFLIATIIYGMLLRNCKNQSRFFMFLATVAFTALVGVLWEVCEYAIDGMSGSNMQRFNDSVTNEPFVGRRALLDTMTDLMMDSVGGLLAGLYFAFTSIKGIPLYKFLELKRVKADMNIQYQEDDVRLEQIKMRKAEKQLKKNTRKKLKAKAKQYSKQKQKFKKEQKQQEKLTNKKANVEKTAKENIEN